MLEATTTTGGLGLGPGTRTFGLQISSRSYTRLIYFRLSQVKDGKWHHTVLEIDTPKPYRLPILDIAAYDIGDSGEEFGIEIERLCFS